MSLLFISRFVNEQAKRLFAVAESEFPNNELPNRWLCARQTR
ncbi:hypothetical protein HMPREF0201_01873 [Cedecea davisae DSM 4568]|uniref:Uncharacterized protein n=1 Tax=Cedecea davisae DSM 4568 TaxID=566551 RepID=S3JXX5_9ENTR|nr:hypothetical protein HMPREF0201_01873 [Cedecea davisae DSM 4568]